MNPLKKIIQLSFFNSIIISLSLGTSLAANTPDDSKWEYLYEEDGIVVSKKDMPNSDICAFRGVGIVDAPMEKLLTVLRDIANAHQWIESVKNIHTVRVISPLSRVEYYHIGLPWLMTDRDFVYQANLEINKETKQVSLVLNSVTDPLAPEQSDKVRGAIFNTSVTMYSIDNGKRTHATGIAYADPKGSIPKWMVNKVQQKWPYNTFMNVRKAVASPKLKASADFTEMVRKLNAPDSK